MGRRLSVSIAAAAAVLVAAPAAPAAQPDVARYVLPPGNFGGLPTNENSLDQLPLYSGLTPKRGNVTRSDLDRFYLPEDFKPIGKTHDEQTGRKGLRLRYDSYGVPHIYGKTRGDVSFGAGWATARDRSLLFTLGRGPARAAVADIPGIDAFSLVTSGQSFTPSAQAEALVTQQRKLLVQKFGAKGRQIIRDAQAYVDGINAYLKANNSDQPPATVNDVIATTAFIGSIFGAGGGGEARNADLLAKLRVKLGRDRAQQAWEDVMLADDPEAPTTIKRRFDYGPLTGGKVKGSVVVDPGSIVPFDPRVDSAVSANAASAPPRRQASNFLVASPGRSRTGNALGVMGPQLGYYYPEIVEQMDLHGPGFRAQGAAVPGLSMYILIGRTPNYAWSLTSAGHDVRDVYAERLCEPDGSAPSRASTHYVFRGSCRAMNPFYAGKLGDREIHYQTTVHGPVIGTATIAGAPYALSRRRSTFGRDSFNLAALKDMTEGKASTPKRFWKAANQFGFTFNWAYVSRKATAYFSSGLLPKRAPGLDRRLPTLGTGQWEWRGYLSERRHPHATSGPKGLLLNWNNRSAPGFMHGDDEPYGSVQRVELFNQWPKHPRIADVASVMNRAATEDLRAQVWPVVSAVLRKGSAPDARSAQVVSLLDAWVKRDAPRIDADDDGTFDESGPTIMDDLWPRLADTVMRPVFGDLTSDLDAVRGLNGQSGHSYVDKDLRRLLGRKERGKFHLRYCGDGSVATCSASLWAAVSASATALAAKYASDDPAAWRGPGNRTRFTPGLISDTIPFTNRPTFQQVLELQRR